MVFLAAEPFCLQQVVVLLICNQRNWSLNLHQYFVYHTQLPDQLANHPLSWWTRALSWPTGFYFDLTLHFSVLAKKPENKSLWTKNAAWQTTPPMVWSQVQSRALKVFCIFPQQPCSQPSPSCSPSEDYPASLIKGRKARLLTVSHRTDRDSKEGFITAAHL